MTVTIHMGSMLLGFFLGYVVIATLFLYIGFTDTQWDKGFSDGYKVGCKIRRSYEDKDERATD